VGTPIQKHDPLQTGVWIGGLTQGVVSEQNQFSGCSQSQGLLSCGDPQPQLPVHVAFVRIHPGPRSLQNSQYQLQGRQSVPGGPVLVVVVQDEPGPGVVVVPVQLSGD